MQPQIEVYLAAREEFAEFRPQSAVCFYVCRIVAIGRNTGITRQENRPFIVKPLGDHDKTLLTENLLRPDDRIQCPESRIVEENRADRHTAEHQFVAHVFGFIVIRGTVVSAHEDVLDLTAFVQRNRRIDAVEEKCIFRPVAEVSAGTEQQADFRSRDFLQIGGHKSSRICCDPEIGISNEEKQEKADFGRDKEELVQQEDDGFFGREHDLVLKDVNVRIFSVTWLKVERMGFLKCTLAIR